MEVVAITALKWVTGISVLGVGSGGVLAAMFYKTVPANKFLAKTGPFVKGVHVSRKTFQLPFQRLKTISLEPITYKFTGNNMSREMVPFELPIIFTVSPVHPDKDMEGFVRYATCVGDMTADEYYKLIAGIVNGETRGFVGSMTIAEIFNDKDAFRNNVLKRVTTELAKFGIEIHNANVEEMHDTKGNVYFENLKRKALEEANTQSRIAVAEARKVGDIGEKDREATTRKGTVTLEANAKESETQQNQRMSDYSRLLSITATTNKQQEDMARLEAYKTVEESKITIESDLNRRKQTQELEKLRSDEVIKATAEAETVVKRAEADAAAVKIKAEAQAYQTKIHAEANLYEKNKQAEGVQAMLQAQANGLKEIYDASKSNPEMAAFYLALDKGLYSSDGMFTHIAREMGNAVRGMEPKINVWSTGAAASGNITDVITNLAKTMPPILDAIQQQTGISLPNFVRNTHNTENKSG